MSKSTKPIETEGDDGSSRVEMAFDAIANFHERGLSDLNLKGEFIEKCAEDEVIGKHVLFDEYGFSAGMRKAIIRPIHEMSGQWNDLRNKFNIAIQPFRERIDALEKVGDKISALDQQEEVDLADVDEFANLSPVHKKIAEEHVEANAIYDIIYSNEGARLPTTYANNPLYWVALLAVGAAEWIINYDIILRFLGIPAIAVGVTLIIGVLLAFAAHAHGTILKQWNDLFSDSKSRKEKMATWRIMAFANFAAVLVFGFAGATRYSIAIDLAKSFSQPSINLGGPTLAGPSPLGEVGISLFANVAAWAVGVFIAYLCHDRVQEFMNAAKRKKKANKAYAKSKHAFVEKKQIIKSKRAEEERKARNNANVRVGSVAKIKGMELQVQEHERAFKAALAEKGDAAARAYLDDLIILARKPESGVEFSNADGALDIIAVQKIVPAFMQVAFPSVDGGAAQ